MSEIDDVPAREKAAAASDGWTAPLPEKIPQPTFWPAAMALGTVLFLFGVVTLWPVSLSGLALIAVSLSKWIGELADGD